MNPRVSIVTGLLFADKQPAVNKVGAVPRRLCKPARKAAL